MFMVEDDSFKNFSEASELPFLICFTSQRCQPCKVMVPLLEEISSQYFGKVNFAVADVHKCLHTANLLAVRSVPTIMLFKNGRPFAQVTGIRSKKNMIEFINKLL